MVRWVAGCERILTSRVAGKQKAKSQTDGEGKRGWQRGGGGKGLTPYFLISKKRWDTFFKWVVRRTKNLTLLPSPFKLADVCWFLNQALDSDSRSVAKGRSRESPGLNLGKGTVVGKAPPPPPHPLPFPSPAVIEKPNLHHNIYSIRLQSILSSWNPLCDTISCPAIILSLTIYFSLYLVFYRLK